MAVASVRILEDKHYEVDNGKINKFACQQLVEGLPAHISSLGLCTPPAVNPDFTLRRLSLADKEDTLKFLRRFFFRDEPMNQAVALLPTPEARCFPLEEYAVASLGDGFSVVAVDGEGEIVAVVINGLVKRQDPAPPPKQCTDPKFSKILLVLEHLEREAKVWEKVAPTCSSILEVKIVSTHKDWRGRGLMRVMCEESEKIALEMGARAMRMDATSAFSAAAAERLSYKMIYSVKYSQLPGAPLPAPPHLEARVYLKEL